MDYAGSCNKCAVLCSWFVEIEHMASVEMYIFSIYPELHNLLKYAHGMVILGGHASAESINSSFRGNPYLITKLYSEIQSVTCVVHVSCV